MSEKRKAYQVLLLNTLAFTVCFACWMLNGVLVTFLIENQVFRWSDSEVGWLIGIPVLTGSLLRLHVGMWTDIYGGRIVFTLVMLFSAVPLFLLSFANDFWTYFLASLGFGFVGTSFAVGIAYSSLWFPREQQGTALGIFGAGNVGSAVTTFAAPWLLRWVTDNGQNLENWRYVPRLYASVLFTMAVVFWFFTYTKVVDGGATKKLREHLRPLRHIRVWRFGLYYFLVFGGFVALAQWLMPYYVSVYAMPLVTAGLLVTLFNVPAGLVRIIGGYVSDKFGARRAMYWVLTSCFVCSLLLVFPRMDIESPGKSVLAKRSGTVVSVSADEIVVDDVVYKLKPRQETLTEEQKIAGMLIFPKVVSWQEPVVKPGDKVVRKQLLARGATHIYFQANVWVFTMLVFIIGFMMGVGKAAVYKHIPEYFPKDVGVVGGLVGLIGGLGGFVCPIIFGYALEYTGLWTTCWMFFAALSAICLWWMHSVIQRMQREEAPHVEHMIDRSN